MDLVNVGEREQRSERSEVGHEGQSVLALDILTMKTKGTRSGPGPLPPLWRTGTAARTKDVHSRDLHLNIDIATIIEVDCAKELLPKNCVRGGSRRCRRA